MVAILIPNSDLIKKYGLLENTHSNISGWAVNFFASNAALQETDLFNIS